MVFTAPTQHARARQNRFQAGHTVARMCYEPMTVLKKNGNCFRVLLHFNFITGKRARADVAAADLREIFQCLRRKSRFNLWHELKCGFFGAGL